MEGVEVRDEGLVKPAAVTVSAVAFLVITIACIATALPAMISTYIRAGNHDKGKDDDRQKNDTDYIHFTEVSQAHLQRL